MGNLIKMLTEIRYGDLGPASLKNEYDNLLAIKNDPRAYNAIYIFEFNDIENFNEDEFNGSFTLSYSWNDTFKTYYDEFLNGNKNLPIKLDLFSQIARIYYLRNEREEGRLIAHEDKSYYIFKDKFDSDVTILKMYIRVIHSKIQEADSVFKEHRYNIIYDDLEKCAIDLIATGDKNELIRGYSELIIAEKEFNQDAIDYPEHAMIYNLLSIKVDYLIHILKRKIDELGITSLENKIRWKGSLSDFVNSFLPIIDNKFINVKDYKSRKELLEDLYSKFYIENEKKPEEVKFSGFKNAFDEKFRNNPKLR
ncbi:hypothetical protein [Saccharicrinis sp. FJH54]|uniref:hypothetical protein n=1 Tax=Saccharicrinis sp. FJH54 TaxID=3344665 RepID=UPI0035D44E4E